MQIDLQSPKRNRVDLNDYNYRQDVKNRLALAKLDVTTTQLLIELFYLPSKISLSKLKSSLNLDDADLKDFLEQISALKILSCESDSILIDKEAKKNIECFIEKFSEDFVPGIEYFQSLLKHVPINILPTWYTLPRTCESIFNSLKEKVFLTPQQYLRHLFEVDSEETPINSTIRALMQSPDYSLSVEQIGQIAEKEGEELEAFILELEYNFVGVLSFAENVDRWDARFVLPFELKEYLQKQSCGIPFTKLEQTSVKPDRGIPLSFAFDLSQTLRFTKMQRVKMIKQQPDPSFVDKLAQNLGTDTIYAAKLIARGIELQLLMIEDDFLVLYPQAETWLLYTLDKQSLSLFKALWIQKHPQLKQSEKGLSVLNNRGWVLQEEVIRLVTYGKPILQRGRSGYTYELTDQVHFTKELLIDLNESGIIEFGSYENKPSIRLTDFGKQICS
jgi:hypothetical protein